jgi:hypothetical protein
VVESLLTEFGHEVIVAHAQKVRLIAKSRRKNDRMDARTLARLARIDPPLLSPQRRSPGSADRDPRPSRPSASPDRAHQHGPGSEQVTGPPTGDSSW